MANYATLKAAIQAVIKTNGNEEITGALLQQSLLAMIESLGVGYQFMGIATPSTNPGTPDQNVFYVASTAGIYSNFGSISLAGGEIAILKYNGSWSKDSTGAASLEKVNEIEQKFLIVEQEYDKSNTSQMSISANGSWGLGSGYTGTVLVPITPGVTYRVTNNTGTNSLIAVLAESSVGSGAVDFATGFNGRIVLPAGESFFFTAPGDALTLFLLVVNSAGNSCAPSVYTQLVADTLSSQAAQIANKLDKIIGTNLVNPATLVANKVIYSSGKIGNATGTNWAVTDYIPVNGQNIISNAYVSSSSIASYNVYDADFNLLRTVTQNAQYTYQVGDAYVRFTIQGGSKRANYGTTLAAYEPYTDYAPVGTLQKQVKELQALAEQIPDKLDKIIGTNLVNPEEIEHKKALGWNTTTGIPTNVSSNNYVVTGFIPVNGQDIITNAFSTNGTWATMFIYDANKNFLRNNGTNQQYTYQEGDAYVRISYNSGAAANQKANYGTTLAAYTPYTDYAPVQALDARVSAIEGRIGNVNFDYTSVALFKSMAIVGDSYSSGAVYGLTPSSLDGPHYNMSWLSIMARRNGINDMGLYATPAQNTTKFLDANDSRYSTYGLGAMLADTAKDLYFIMLGINAEPDGVGIGTIADCNEDWTLNASSFYGNYGKIIGNIKTHAPNAKIVCIVPNMLFSNSNPGINDTKKAAINAVAEFYSVMHFEALDDDYFSSTFYVSALSTNHPVGVTYAGMALAFERLLSACIQSNETYFKNYVNA